MRRAAAFALSVGLSPFAAAQQAPLSAYPSAAQSPFLTPGTAVGQPLLKPVGTQLPKAAPAAGTPVGQTPGGAMPTDITSTLPGQKFDMANVVGPLPESTMLPTEPTLWDKFVAKFGATLGFVPPQPKAPDWTPGIARRNRERARERHQMWQRD